MFTVDFGCHPEDENPSSPAFVDSSLSRIIVTAQLVRRAIASSGRKGSGFGGLRLRLRGFTSLEFSVGFQATVGVVSGFDFLACLSYTGGVRCKCGRRAEKEAAQSG